MNVVSKAVEAAGGAVWVAVRLGVSVRSVHRWIDLGVVPGARECFALADLANVSTRELCGSKPIPDDRELLVCGACSSRWFGRILGAGDVVDCPACGSSEHVGAV